jgi:hypothetical protein
MYELFDIYKIFRRLQGNCKGVGYRLPKDWDSHYRNKMSAENKRALETLTAFFNTKWQNIDPEKYLKTGFDLYGNKFSYRRFTDRKVLMQYIQNDKMEKRRIGSIQEEVRQSVDYVSRVVNDNDVGSKMVRYCSMKVGQMGKPVDDYISGKITKSFIVLLMWYGFYTPTREELEKMPYVTAHYNEIIRDFSSSTVRELCDKLL